VAPTARPRRRRLKFSWWGSACWSRLSGRT